MPQQIDVINSVVSEQLDREKKREKLFVFGIPLSGYENKEIKDKYNKNYIENTFCNINLDVPKIKFIRYFGSLGLNIGP